MDSKIMVVIIDSKNKFKIRALNVNTQMKQSIVCFLE